MVLGNLRLIVQTEVHQRLIAVIVAVFHTHTGLYVPEVFLGVGLEVVGRRRHGGILVILVIVTQRIVQTGGQSLQRAQFEECRAVEFLTVLFLDAVLIDSQRVEGLRQFTVSHGTAILSCCLIVGIDTGHSSGNAVVLTIEAFTLTVAVVAPVTINANTSL